MDVPMDWGSKIGLLRRVIVDGKEEAKPFLEFYFSLEQWGNSMKEWGKLVARSWNGWNHYFLIRQQYHIQFVYQYQWLFDTDGLFCLTEWPSSFSRSGLTDADVTASAISSNQQQSAAVSSCRWQVVYESFLTFCEPILKRSTTESVGRYTVSIVNHCDTWTIEGIVWNLAAFLKILKFGCITSLCQLPRTGRPMRWHHLMQVTHPRHVTGWGKLENTLS